MKLSFTCVLLKHFHIQKSDSGDSTLNTVLMATLNASECDTGLGGMSTVIHIDNTDVARQHFPEEFLWHCFKCLIDSALTLASGPFRMVDWFSRNPGTWRHDRNMQDLYLLHCDIKPHNSASRHPADELY